MQASDIINEVNAPKGGIRRPKWLLEPGTYDCVVTECEGRVSGRSGQKMLQLTLCAVVDEEVLTDKAAKTWVMLPDIEDMDKFSDRCTEKLGESTAFKEKYGDVAAEDLAQTVAKDTLSDSLKFNSQFVRQMRAILGADVVPDTPKWDKDAKKVVNLDGSDCGQSWDDVQAQRREILKDLVNYAEQVYTGALSVDGAVFKMGIRDDVYKGKQTMKVAWIGLPK